VDFPSSELEREIVQTRVPEFPAQLVSRLVAFMHRVRRLALRKAPSVSETLDWAKVLLVLNAGTLDRDFVTRTLNVFLKHEEDLRTVAPLVPELLAAGRGEGA